MGTPRIISGLWGDLMENIMYIKWDTGHMNIVLQNFFPCSVAKFKKLLKVIALDWENCDKLTEDLTHSRIVLLMGTPRIMYSFKARLIMGKSP